MNKTESERDERPDGEREGKQGEGVTGLEERDREVGRRLLAGNAERLEVTVAGELRGSRGGPAVLLVLWRGEEPAGTAGLR